MKVAFSISNYTKCLCPVCRVQAKSECQSSREESWRQTRSIVGRILEDYPEHPEAYEMEADALAADETGKKHGFSDPRSGPIRELYCSAGRSDCQDLDGEKRCVCADCLVWEETILGKSYYCLQGSSEELEGE